VENFDYVQLLSRWLHITAAVAAGGGVIFMKLALHPATETLPGDTRAEVREAVRSRWAKVVHGAILVLLLTGLFNFMVIIKTYDVPKGIYHGVFGLKFLLAMGIFFFGSVLVGRGELAKKLRTNAGKWLSVVVALLLVLLLASSTLKNLDHKRKDASPATPAAAG
jgi:putative copper export protein